MPQKLQPADRQVLADALLAIDKFRDYPRTVLEAVFPDSLQSIFATVSWAKEPATLAIALVQRLDGAETQAGVPALGTLAFALIKLGAGEPHKSNLKGLAARIGWVPPKPKRAPSPKKRREPPNFTGTRMGPFQVHNLLGKGGFAVVYRATDTRNGTEVALKILVNRKNVADARRETTLPRINHPRVLEPLVDTPIFDQRHYCFPLPLMKRSLRDLLNERRTLSFQDAARIIFDLADALIPFHTKLIHRDLRPENILLDDRDRAHIADLGLALRQGDKHKPEWRELVEGNAAYMAPEVLKKFYRERFPDESIRLSSASVKEDIYPLGAIFWELLVGRYFLGETHRDLEARLGNINCIPDPPNVEKPDIPPALSLICMSCLQTDPSSRMADATNLKNALAPFIAPDPPPIPPPPAPRLPSRPEEEIHLAQLIAEVKLKALLYSPLEGIAQIRPESKNADILRAWQDDPDVVRILFTSHHRQQPRKTEYSNILTAFREVKRASLLGAPGAGKSTTLRRLALQLAEEAQNDRRAPIPVYAALKEWSAGQSLHAFLAAAAPELGASVLALGRANRLILLLDGLNELPDRKGQVAALRNLAVDLPHTAIFVSCRLEDYKGPLDLSGAETGAEIQASPHGLTVELHRKDSAPAFDTLTLEPLSRERIRTAVAQWLKTFGRSPAKAEAMADDFYWQLAGDPKLREVLAKWLQGGATEHDFWTLKDPSEHMGAYWETTWVERELWQRHIPSPRNLLKLASNPQMLTMLFQQWAGGEALPKNRGELFQGFVGRLLHRENEILRVGNQPTFDVAAIIRGLEGLAWAMQTSAVVEVPRPTAIQGLGSETFLRHALDASILEGGERISFRHQLFQEYFAARALATRIPSIKTTTHSAHVGQPFLAAAAFPGGHNRTLDGVSPAISPQPPTISATELWPPDRWWESNNWEQTAVLLTGLYPDDCTKPIQWLADAQPEVAALCIQQSGAEVPDSLLHWLRERWLPRLTNRTTDPMPQARAAVGLALARLHLDKRFGVGLTKPSPSAKPVPQIDWVEVPGGSFLYGDKKVPTKIDTFWMARYPVTNLQFQAFLDAEDGYQQPQWWKAGGGPQEGSVPPDWPEDNCPREMVSWFEAMAFCAWLTERPGFSKKNPVRLPTEKEWERAARGITGSVYPWGDTYEGGHANIHESGISTGSTYLKRTSPVGIYYPWDDQPRSADDPPRIHDLAGNVWEWCSDRYTPEEESRVLRGESWFDDQVSARAAYRVYGTPGYRNSYVGFRVVCWSPIPAAH